MRTLCATDILRLDFHPGVHIIDPWTCRIDDYLRLCADYQADFGIFAGHVACKHGLGGIGLFREASREAGIPLLYFEFDMFDPRVTPVETIQEDITNFVEDVVRPRKEAA